MRIGKCILNQILQYLPRCLYFAWLTFLVVTSLSDSEPNVSYSVIGMWSVKILSISESVEPGLSDSKNFSIWWRLKWVYLLSSCFFFKICVFGWFGIGLRFFNLNFWIEIYRVKDMFKNIGSKFYFEWMVSGNICFNLENVFAIANA